MQNLKILLLDVVLKFKIKQIYLACNWKKKSIY